MTDIRLLFGQGLAFPIRPDGNKTLAWSRGEDNVRQSIMLILLTERGERVMLPEFGAGLKRFLFQPNTVATRRLIEEEITRALERWEPRIELENISVEADAEDAHAAIATVNYRLVANRSRQELQLQVQLN